MTVPVASNPPVSADVDKLSPARVTLPPPPPVTGFKVRLAISVFDADALIVTFVDDNTTRVTTGNVAEVCPAGTTTVGATVAFKLLDERLTVTPPEGAAAVSVTVPVAGNPPMTVEGEMLKLASVGDPPPTTGFNVMLADTVFPAVAEMVAVIDDNTGSVVTAKLADVCPADTSTAGGTVAFKLFDDRLTVTPPAGAAAVKVTVPVAGNPPMTVEGVMVRLARLPAGPLAPGFRVRFADTVFAADALMVTVEVDDTGIVAMANDADVCPARTMIDGGTAATELLLERLTVTPPAGAAAVKVTVPAAGVPPVTEEGEIVRLAIVPG